jgi:hypothetical protein
MHSFSQIEVKESRNVSNLLPIKLYFLISNLDLFATVLGYVCTDVTLAYRDRLGEDGSNVGLWKGKVFRLLGLRRHIVRLNY